MNGPITQEQLMKNTAADYNRMADKLAKQKKKAAAELQVQQLRHTIPSLGNLFAGLTKDKP